MIHIHLSKVKRKFTYYVIIEGGILTNGTE